MNIKKLILSFLIILTFITGIIFILYYSLGFDKYDYLGKNAPISTELHPVVAKNSDLLIEKAAQLDIQVVLTETTRSIEEQNKLYEQGRTSDGSIVTNAKGGESYHNYGLAIDFALQNHNDELIWDINYDGNKNGVADWIEVSDLAKELGFEWGGDWKHFKDYPHLQMTFGLNITQLQQGFRPKEEMD